MTTKLENTIWTEKYRPKNFEDLVCENKNTLISIISDPKSIPSLIFYSSSPGTGKTSTAKILVNKLGTDVLCINASDERGIDTIREKIKLYAQSMSSNRGLKRCVFLDEADGLTKQAQESMKALMEMYSNNCFFILSCNDISKIIEPIRKGRCLSIDFSRPDKKEIQKRLQTICSEENIEFSEEELCSLVNREYPDMRSMILILQTTKLEGKSKLNDVVRYSDFMKAMKEKNTQYLYDAVYSNNFNMIGFIDYYWKKLFESSDRIPLDKISRVALLLADICKNSNAANFDIIFLSNILEIIKGS